MEVSPPVCARADLRPTRTRFAVLAWLCAAAALAYVSRNAIGVAESTVRESLGISRQQSGWLISAFFFSYALCQIPAARLGQRLGSRKALALFALAWSIATALCGLAPGLGLLIAARVLQGVAQAGLCPVTAGALSKWFPKTGQAFAGGAFSSFMSVGGALGSWLTGVLLLLFRPHTGPGWSWRLVFLVFALPGLLWALGFWLWFRDDPASHKGVNGAELDLIRRGRTAQEHQDHQSGPRATPWRGLLSSPALWWICAQQVFSAAGYIFFSSWFATYLQETRHVSIVKSGFLNMLPLLAFVLGALAGGALSDWLLRRTGRRGRARRDFSIVTLLLCAVLVFSSIGIQDTLSAVLVISLGSFFSALSMPCAFALTMDMGGAHIPTVMAAMNMMGNLGAWAFPIAAPWLLQHFGSWDAVLRVFGGCYLASAFFWWLLNPEGTILEQSLTRGKAAGVE